MKHDSPFVVYIITKLELGGAQKVCLSLFEQRQKSNPNQTVLISGQEGVLVDTAKQNSNVLLLPDLTREVSGIIKECKTFFALVRILRSLRKEHPHIIVHTHSTKAGILGRWAAFCARVPQRVHTVHGFGFHQHQQPIAWFMNYLCELITSFITTHYICVARTDITTGTKRIPFFARKNTLIRACATVLPPTDPIMRDYQTIHIFGTISCFKKQKNIFDLLRAFALCYEQNNQCRLEIIGDGALRPAIEQWINAHNLNSVITLHGWQSNVAPFLLKWHTFVLTSLWEGLPCAAVEARLYKLPVIAYNVGGMSEIIYHGKNGFLCMPKDVRSISRHMHALSTQHALWQQCATYPDTLSAFLPHSMYHDHQKLYRTIE